MKNEKCNKKGTRLSAFFICLAMQDKLYFALQSYIHFVSYMHFVRDIHLR